MRKLMILGLASLLVAIPFATSAQEAFTTRSVNVRAGPDTSYPAVATLGGGAPVEVIITGAHPRSYGRSGLHRETDTVTTRFGVSFFHD